MWGKFMRKGFKKLNPCKRMQGPIYWSGGEDELNKFKKNIKIKMLHVERKKIIYKKF